MPVVDASALAGWLLPDEDGPDLGSLFAGVTRPSAPWLLWAEIRNILLVAERRRRLDPVETDSLIDLIDRLGIERDADPDQSAVMALARRHGLTVYDALYLDLARRCGTGLATLDRALAGAAAEEGVPLL